jgi:hypothetical protein
MFLRSPFTEEMTTASAAYGAVVYTNTVHPGKGALTYAKVSGPAWLTVSANGALTGTPGVQDIGTNTFIVSLTDTNGWSSTAIVSINVLPLPSLSISAQGVNIVLTWSGGQPPYSIQMANDLASPVWQTIAGPLTNNALLVTPSNSPAFYRIQSR